jgi:L-ascorbate metabolism protein UlaG (beta-lactamase superfamily)
MKVHFYVNAMVMLESTQTKVLCDPWVTFDNESDSGFYNFPKCSMTREQVAALKPDYIYITHTHPDHFDPPTLDLFDKNTPVLVAPYEKNFTEREVRKLGFTDVRVVPLGDGLQLNGDDRAWIEPAAVYSEVDSMAVFRLGGETVLNANDNVFNQEQCARLRDAVGGIDVALLPSAAHGPWPMFFENLTHEEKLEEAEKRATNQKQMFLDYVNAVRPRYVVPFAGGIICAGDKARMYGYSGIRARSEVVAFAKDHADFDVALVSEGCIFDSESGEVAGKYIEKTHATEAAYIEELANMPSLFGPKGRFYVAESERIDLSRLLHSARLTQKRHQEEMGLTSKSHFYFDVGEEQLYGLCLADENVVRIRESEIPKDQEYEIYRMPYELLLGMLTRHYVWSNINTQHISFYRHMPQLDHDLLLVLNFLQV